MHGSTDPAPERENAVERINVLRGLAILGVIAVHTAAHFTYAPGPSPVVSANIILDVLAHYAAPLFILLSGLTLARRYGRGAAQMSAKSFYARRLTKIVPPYVVFSLFYLLLFASNISRPRRHGWRWRSQPAAHTIISGLLRCWCSSTCCFRCSSPPCGGRGRAMRREPCSRWRWRCNWPGTWAPPRSQQPPRPPAVPDDPLGAGFSVAHLLLCAGHGGGAEPGRLRAAGGRVATALLGVVVVGLVALTSSIWIRAIAGYGSLNEAPTRLFVPAIATEPLLFLSTMALLWRLARRVQGRSSGLANALAGLGILSLSIYLVHVFFQWLLARWMAPFGVTPADWAFYPVMFAGTVALELCGGAGVFAAAIRGATDRGAAVAAPANHGVQPAGERVDGERDARLVYWPASATVGARIAKSPCPSARGDARAGRQVVHPDLERVRSGLRRLWRHELKLVDDDFARPPARRIAGPAPGCASAAASGWPPTPRRME